jgi:aspartyl-tRNA(Asn)/glutamyl-tRNA(Gln) amidotransferase subunit A
MNLNLLTIEEAHAKLMRQEITALELTADCLDAISKMNQKINACLTVCEQEALLSAKVADLRIKKGETGKLLGIPFVAKDNILTKGIRTTAASKILENYIAPYDATIITKLKDAGAVLLAKTNLDEFAHGASTENSAFGPTRNPWDLERVAGGSSGGSAAAVAAGMCIFAIGTDTGGSIRCPASFCGVSGLKPTYGRSSRFGLISMTSSTDVPGPITKTAQDAQTVLSVICGQDKHDATTVDADKNQFEKGVECDMKKIKIGLPEEYFTEGLDGGVLKAIQAAIAKFEAMGAEIVKVNLPYTKYAVPVYYIITPSEVSSNLARFDGIRFGLSDTEGKNLFEIYTKSRGRGFGPEAKRRIMLGTYALSAGYYDAYYLQAQKVRTLIKEEMDDCLKTVDILLTPTAPHVAFKIGSQSNDPLKMYLEDIFVSGASLAGLPAISIPVGFDNNMPVGMQLIGSRFNEKIILDIAQLFQRETDYHNQLANK